MTISQKGPLDPRAAQARIFRAPQPAKAPIYTGVACASFLLAALALHLWKADFHVPFYYAEGGDLLSQVVAAQTLAHHWTIFTQHARLAAPLGTSFADIPLIIFLHLAAERILALITGNGILALNLYYLAIFPLSAMTALFAMRRFGLSTEAAFAPALLFSILPYRFYRNESHLDYAAYWFVPLTVLACVLVARDVPLWRASPNPFRHLLRHLPTKAGWFTIVAMVGTGCDNQYNTFFAILFLGVAAALGATRTRSARPVIAALLLIALLFGTISTQTLPSAIYQQTHGKDVFAYKRYPEESQYYGLQIAQLLLPVPDHRLPIFAAKRLYFDTHAFFNNENSWVSLGTIGSIGFLTLLALLLIGFRRRLDPNLEALTFFNISAVLLATVGGFGTIFNFLTRPEIRAYNRISPFIAFFSLTVIAYSIDWTLRRHKVPFPHSTAWLATGILTLLGALDQTTHTMVPPYEASAAQFASDSAFGQAVDGALPPGTAVFELPSAHYPESIPIVHLDPFAEFRPYLHTTSTRWSYAANDGRAPAAWDQATTMAAPHDMLQRLILGGFKGICVFRAGFADNGQAVEASLHAVLGPPRVVSADGQMALYSLVPLFTAAVAADPRIGTAPLVDDTVHTVDTSYGNGFYGMETSGDHVWYWAINNADIYLDNDGTRTRHLRLHALLQIGSRPDVVTATFNGTVIAQLHVGSAKTPITLDLRLPPGRSTLSLSTPAPPMSAPDTRTLVFAVFDPIITSPDEVQNPALTRLFTRLGTSSSSSSGLTDTFGDISLHFSRGCSARESSGLTTWHWCDRSGDVVVTSKRKQRIRITAQMTTPGMPDASVSFTLAGARQTLPGSAHGATLSLIVAVAPGKPAKIGFFTDAKRFAQPADPRALYLRFDAISAMSIPERSGNN
jgi:phosphoglycerol transferase